MKEIKYINTSKENAQSDGQNSEKESEQQWVVKRGGNLEFDSTKQSIILQGENGDASNHNDGNFWWEEWQHNAGGDQTLNSGGHQHIRHIFSLCYPENKCNW